MAECSEREEKPSSLDEPVSLKIYVENAGSHEMRKNCYNDLNSKNHESSIELTEGSRTGDLKTLTDAEFLHLLKEATTFNQPSQPESVLLKQLRKEVSAIPETSSNVTYVANSSSRFVPKSNTDNCDLPDISYESNYTCPTSQRTRKQKHNKSNSKPSLNLNALEKNPNRSQSLKDLSSDSVKSKQKSHKSQRTLSLSSEEAIALISDSFTSKPSKKSKQSNSSKSELNKTNRGPSKVPPSSESLITLEIDDVNSKGPHSSNCESLPYQLLVNETAISLPSSRKNSSSEKSAIDCPVEIEMEEIKSDKDTKNDKALSSNKELKTKNGPQQSNSKFYVDYTNDVDATVAFPLKLISSVDEQTEGLTDQFKRQVFPMVPWPKPVQVQSFFSSLPMEGDSFSSRNEKQLQDINGNPFTRPSRPSSLASFVSTTLLDYNNSSLISEPKNRKNKRAKNAVDNSVRSEDIAGYRGKEDIDSLLEYINSSDKNKKSTVKSPQNQLLSNKNSMFHDHDKKKSIKDFKNCQKNLINSEKKKLTRCNSLESIPHTEKDKPLTYSYEAGDTRMESPPKDATVAKQLDINSNVEKRLSYLNEKSNNASSTEEICTQNLNYTFPEVSSFAADFYSTANVSSQTNEESGFHVVKKRHKRKQSKRSDSYRWRNGQIQHKNGMMIPLADSKCGKQDSRRKSTSSVPHSEHTSNDNSDADSVHSLPVVSSNLPTQTGTLPHTTPSSSSSTPQASYADIARMPITKLNSPVPCMISYSGQNKQQGGDMEKIDSTTVPHTSRKVSESHESSKSLNKELSCAAGEDKRSGPESTIQTHVKSTREINTQTEPQGSDTASSHVKKTDTGHVCSNCLLPQSECSCLKQPSSVRRKTKSADIPPVIMDNMPPETNSCNFTFGFGIDEVLRMTPSESLPCPKKIINEDYVDKCDFKNTETVDKSIALNEVSNASSDSYSKCSLTPDATQTILSQDLPKEKSSQRKKVTYGSSGKSLVYCETEINSEKFNSSQFSNFMESEYQAVKEELKAFSDGKSNKRVVYYKCSEDTVPSKPH